MKLKATLLDRKQVERSLARMAHEIIEKNDGVENLCLLGIKKRGLPLAEILQDNIQRFSGKQVACGNLDITFYRDDLSPVYDQPHSKSSHIPVQVEDYRCIIVDDVLYTGRTARAAMDLIFDQGRPRAIQLAVLVDRGHRELPIKPDYVGKNIPTSSSENVKVMVDDYDGEMGVYLYEK